jgi:hypothetical protein
MKRLLPAALLLYLRSSAEQSTRESAIFVYPEQKSMMEMQLPALR